MVIILLEILLALSIIVCLFLLVVLWRLFFVLGDLQSVTSTVSKRVKELDENVEKFKKTVSEGLEAVKGFLFSLEFIKKVVKTIEGKKGE